MFGSLVGVRGPGVAAGGIRIPPAASGASSIVRLMTRANLPELHDTTFAPHTMLGMAQIAKMYDLDHSALRNWATWHRTSRKYGHMPIPVARVSNRPLWNRSDIEAWIGI